MFGVNNNTVRLEQSSNLLKPDMFTWWVILCFLIHVIIFLPEANELMQSVKATLKSLTKHSKSSGDEVLS